MKYSTALAFAGIAAAAPAKVSRQQPEGGNGEMSIQPVTGSKKGIAWTGDLPDALAGVSSWEYTWDQPSHDSGIEAVAMCWGHEYDRCNTENIVNHISHSNDKWVLGYNEPDFTDENHQGGSHLSPQAAYDNWGKQMLPLKDNHNAKLVCPGISSRNEPFIADTGYASGLQWLDQFVKLAPTPAALECDAQAIHWYGLPGVGTASERAEAFTTYLNLAHDHVNKLFSTPGKPANMPLWVTEFGPEPGKAVDRQLLADFLEIVIPWMNEKPWIARHSAYMASLMVEPNGQLNVAGKMFASLN